MDELKKFLFSQSLTQSQDRVGLCTVWITIATIILCCIAWFQLGGIKKVSKADFIQRFSVDFFNETSRFIILLLDYNALTFKVKKISYGANIPIKEFPYFEINKKILDQLKVGKHAENNQRDYSSFEIDDLLLGHFEEIGCFEKSGLIGIVGVYDYFDWYIQVVWNNEEVKKYISYLRESEGSDIYENFEYIFNKSLSFSECKAKNGWVFIWKLKWKISHNSLV